MQTQTQTISVEMTASTDLKAMAGNRAGQPDWPSKEAWTGQLIYFLHVDTLSSLHPVDFVLLAFS